MTPATAAWLVDDFFVPREIRTGNLVESMTFENRLRVGGLILCGGRSRRMGQPKLLLRFGSETMLERVIRILQEVVSPIVVVAAQDQEVPPLPKDVLVVRDEQPDLGPLGGLVAGMSALKSEVDAVYVSACDTPLLQPRFVQRMIESLEDFDMVMPREDRYHHPLAAVYRVCVEDVVRQMIAKDRMRPVFLLEECNAQVIDVEELREVDPDLQSLRNTNTPEEFEAALADAKALDAKIR